MLVLGLWRIGARPILQIVAPDLWIVDGTPLHPLGLTVPIRMTVIRLRDGALILHSPVQFSPALAEELLALGPIGFLLAPSFAHWMMLPAWQVAFPQARTLAAPNLRRRRPVRRARLRIDAEITDTLPAAWQADLRHEIVPGGFGFRELVLLHLPSRTAILTDLVQNLDPAHMPWGLVAGNGWPPVYLRLLVRLGGAPARQAAARILKWRPERAVFSHGDWYPSDAAAKLDRALAWLT